MHAAGKHTLSCIAGLMASNYELYRRAVISIHIFIYSLLGELSSGQYVSQVKLMCLLCCTKCTEIPSNSRNSGHWAVKADNRRESVMGSGGGPGDRTLTGRVYSLYPLGCDNFE